MKIIELLKPAPSLAVESQNAAIIDFGRSARKRREVEKKLRKAEMSQLNIPGKIWYLARHHKAITAAIAIFLLLVTMIGTLASNPNSAEALPIIPIVLVGLAGVLGVGTATNALDEVLRGGINGLIGLTNGILQTLASPDILTKNFSELFTPVYPVIYEIHHQAVIPIANVVLIIFLLVGLGKVLQEMNRSDTGVDLWALCWVFIAYAFAKVAIDASFELMVLAYNIVLQLINNVVTVAQAGGLMGGMTGETGFVGDDIKNGGVLLAMLLVSFISFLITVFVALGAQAALIARAVQIYVYTCYAPIPLAFMVSESSRQMATGFIKKYLAVLFAGAIMVLIFAMMAAMIGGVAMVDINPTDDMGVVTWGCQMLYSLVAIVAFGICIFRSGTWARDFVGL